MENVKLLVVLSLNDMGVKDDFIGVLKGCSKKLKKEIQLQTKITTDIKINRHKIIHKNKVN